MTLISSDFPLKQFYAFDRFEQKLIDQNCILSDRENKSILNDAYEKMIRIHEFYGVGSFGESNNASYFKYSNQQEENQSSVSPCENLPQDGLDFCNPKKMVKLNSSNENLYENAKSISGNNIVQILRSEGELIGKYSSSPLVSNEEKTYTGNSLNSVKVKIEESSDLICIPPSKIQTKNIDKDSNQFLIEKIMTSSNFEYLEELKKYKYQIKEVENPIAPNLKYEFIGKFNNIGNKSFTRCWNLLDHCRTHDKVKPFKCTSGDKAFTQKGNLMKHLRNHSLYKK